MDISNLVHKIRELKCSITKVIWSKKWCVIQFGREKLSKIYKCGLIHPVESTAWSRMAKICVQRFKMINGKRDTSFSIYSSIMMARVSRAQNQLLSIFRRRSWRFWSWRMPSWNSSLLIKRKSSRVWRRKMLNFGTWIRNIRIWW